MLTKEELKLAWQRTKLDRPGRCFIVHPYLFEWIDANLDEWLTALSKRIENGYSPSDSQVCYAPKAGWMVRPGAVIDIQDEVVINAILGTHHEKIFSLLKSSQGGPDVAYQFKDPNNVTWIKHWSNCWNEWRDNSLTILENGIQYVLFADIAAFYENIDFNKLSSDLRSVGFNNEKLKLLMNAFKRWAQTRGKGIPQGMSASDILAKIYLHSVDQALSNEGFMHLRYVDDIRIFCHNALEAKQALLKLNELLRNRGLNLQTAKTKILDIDDARLEIDGIAPLINSIDKRLRKDLIELNISVGEYARLSDIDNFLKQNPDAPPPEVLEHAFAEHFSSPSDDSFNKTLFHYLLTRLGMTRSEIAIDYCTQLLATRPEETEHILRYLKCFSPQQCVIDSIIEYLCSDAAIYEYQNYLVVKWFYEQRIFPGPLLATCRQWAFDRNLGQWLRTYCIAVLGIVGDYSDLEKIESNYSTANSEIEKAEYIVALQRLEKGRRNSFYGRVQGDMFFLQCAIDLVKRLQE